jgi:hypothetical protein
LGGRGDGEWEVVFVDVGVVVSLRRMWKGYGGDWCSHLTEMVQWGQLTFVQLCTLGILIALLDSLPTWHEQREIKICVGLVTLARRRSGWSFGKEYSQRWTLDAIIYVNHRQESSGIWTFQASTCCSENIGLVQCMG